MTSHSRAALLALILLASGCATTDDSALAIPGETAAPPPPAQADIQTGLLVQGRVLFVNVPLRYAVVDFGLGPTPGTGARLEIYRAGKPVGTLRVSGPTRDTTTAGDILSGEAQEGDEVIEP